MYKEIQQSSILLVALNLTQHPNKNWKIKVDLPQNSKVKHDVCNKIIDKLNNLISNNNRRDSET